MVTKYALITDEGTAASETVLCSAHLNAENIRHAKANAGLDVKEADFTNVTGNEECFCIVCGH